MNDRDPLAKTILVFSYGTLRPSLYPHMMKRFGLLSMGKGTLKGPFQMLNLGAFPGLIEDVRLPNRTIVGEVIGVSDLAQADRYEGCNYGHPGNLYDRKIVEVLLENGTPVKTWVYLFNVNEKMHSFDDAGAKMPVVEGGDWATVLGKG